MQEENKEVAVEETVKQEETLQVDESKFKSAGDDSVLKIDLLQSPPVDSESEDSGDSEEVAVVDVENSEEPEEQIETQLDTQEAPIVEEVTGSETTEEEELIAEVQEVVDSGAPLPDNIQKLVEFMNETGGDLSDYVKLNQDYSELDDTSLLHEYYKQTKPHLDNEEINFLMEDNFSYDEDVDDERDIRRKKLALKEQVAGAKSHLDGQKSKYYDEIKNGSKLTNEQQEAINFYHKHNEELEESKVAFGKSRERFTQKTENVFNDKFKGFEYEVGDKRFRFNVKNASEVHETQKDIDNFVKKFLNENNEIEDAKGFHRAIYTGMNADAIASHFYEQGKADALKNSITKSKNIDMNPRQSHGVIDTGGIKYKVLGDDSTDFKFKIKNKN
jgi:hypothetical protein